MKKNVGVFCKKTEVEVSNLAKRRMKALFDVKNSGGMYVILLWDSDRSESWASRFRFEDLTQQNVFSSFL